jgi:hypothetical protein
VGRRPPRGGSQGRVGVTWGNTMPDADVMGEIAEIRNFARRRAAGFAAHPLLR